jgi:hypothetical protein
MINNGLFHWLRNRIPFFFSIYIYIYGARPSRIATIILNGPIYLEIIFSILSDIDFTDGCNDSRMPVNKHIVLYY